MDNIILVLRCIILGYGLQFIGAFLNSNMRCNQPVNVVLLPAFTIGCFIISIF